MYALDKQGAEAARKSDTGGGTIKEMGKYVGAFTQAVDLDTKKGGKGIAFSFVSASGQKANLAIYTKGADGSLYQGYDQLMAIMACMGLRNINAKDGEYTKYDYDTRKDVQVMGTLFPELCKPIGLLLETEDYEKQDGTIGSRTVLKNVFQASTELTASEILDRKTTPVQLEKMVEGLRHRPMKGALKHAPMPTRNSGANDYPDMQSDDDSIPF
jgi:hypothetical protein